MKLLTLVSQEDKSKNYVIPTDDGGYFESRFVQRTDDYIIVYLSSHSGCDQACRFCHLTQTRQTMMQPADVLDYIAQAKRVLNDANLAQLKLFGLKKVKFSFMARGEPLLNPTILNKWDVLRRALKELVPPYFDVEFCISTIYPKKFEIEDRRLADIFNTPDVVIYYSVYSLNSDFRKTWLGNAADPKRAFEDLRTFSMATNCRIKLHCSFIKDENDDLNDIFALQCVLDRYLKGVKYKFNIVRYNPYSERQGEKTDVENLRRIAGMLNAKVITRVGKDVKASCGMFYKEDINGTSYRNSMG